MVKLNELRFELLSHSPQALHLTPSDDWLFVDNKKMHQEKNYGLNEEMIAKMKVYFDSIYKSFYKKIIEKLKEHWDECITLEEVYVD